MDAKRFGTKLKGKRKEKGLRYQELADLFTEYKSKNTKDKQVILLNIQGIDKLKLEFLHMELRFNKNLKYLER